MAVFSSLCIFASAARMATPQIPSFRTEELLEAQLRGSEQTGASLSAKEKLLSGAGSGQECFDRGRGCLDTDRRTHYDESCLITMTTRPGCTLDIPSRKVLNLSSFTPP